MLTKPLGTGILSTALKRDRIAEAGMAEAIASMTALNDGAARAAMAHRLRAATDVTGFGLLGHLGNIVNGSGVGARLVMDAVPLLPRAREFAEAGVIPGGTRRNLEAAATVRWDDGLAAADRLLLADAQTSGGLLLAVPPDRLHAVLASLAAEGTLARAVIGELTGERGSIHVTKAG